MSRISTVTCFFLSMTSAFANASIVRGKLVQNANNSLTPAGGYQVTVFSKKTGRSAVSVSDPQGMYYIPNNDAGDMTLEVWMSNNNSNALTFRVKVVEPLTDIAPVIVPTN